jgi:hypothetical protein
MFLGKFHNILVISTYRTLRQNLADQRRIDFALGFNHTLVA